MKEGKAQFSITAVASSKASASALPAPTPPEHKKKRLQFPHLKRRKGASRDRQSKRKTTMAWRWLGSVFQPIMGSANYLLGPLKPHPKPVALPTGALPAAGQRIP
jgi:hypothetical protein